MDLSLKILNILNKINKNTLNTQDAGQVEITEIRLLNLLRKAGKLKVPKGHAPFKMARIERVGKTNSSEGRRKRQWPNNGPSRAQDNNYSRGTSLHAPACGYTSRGSDGDVD